MKTCTKCLKEKSLEDFAWKVKSKELLSASCKDCHKTYSKSHYRKNLSMYAAKNKKARISKAEYIRSLKEVPCFDCGMKFPFYVMEFDHREGEIKKNNVAQMTSSSWKQIKEEVEKCDVVCSNDHSKRTFLRRQAPVA